jgi:hypothetical protein
MQEMPSTRLPSSTEVARFRDRRREHPFHPYEELHSADRWHVGRRAVADEIISGNWRWKGRPSAALEPPLDWEGLCDGDRSWGLALHSWEPLAALLAAHDHDADRASLDLALRLCLDWLERFPHVDGAVSPFAWYDVAIGSRAYRLAYLLDVVARAPDRSDDMVVALLGGLRLHADALGDEARFASHSNHGLYQLMGQLAMARRFPDVAEIAAGGAQAGDRLCHLLQTHFTDEGIHREHSPGYHRLVLIPLGALLRAGLVDDPQLVAILARVEEALAWFVTPAGRYAMFGDTSREAVVQRHPEPRASAALEFALSAGRSGEPPHERTRVFLHSGYAVFRDRWPSGLADFADCSYLAQTCAFHSRVHKHADDLSFVWYDRGSEILTDAGRYGYAGKTDPESELFAEGFWYSDPRRVYVESTCAHNTVEVDGRSNTRRGVEPYGSALTQAGERGEVRFSESHLRHGDLSHTRLLFFLPRRWLIVIDHLFDSGGGQHDFAQRFHLAPELDLRGGKRGDPLATRLPSGSRLHAVALRPQASIEPMRGARQPRLLGWISPADGVLEPQWTFGWEATAASACTFASLFCFADEAPHVVPEQNEINADAHTGWLSWQAGGAHCSLNFERALGRSFEVEHTSAPAVPLKGALGPSRVPRTYSPSL